MVLESSLRRLTAARAEPYIFKTSGRSAGGSVLNEARNLGFIAWYINCKCLYLLQDFEDRECACEEQIHVVDTVNSKDVSKRGLLTVGLSDHKIKYEVFVIWIEYSWVGLTVAPRDYVAFPCSSARYRACSIRLSAYSAR